MASSKTTPPITDRQLQMVKLIYQYLAEHGHYPTLRALMVAMNMTSPSGAMSTIRVLCKKGWVIQTREEGRTTRYILAGVRLVPLIDKSPQGVLLQEALGSADHQAAFR